MINLEKRKIINMGKVCTSTTCSGTQFPHCTECCTSAVMMVEYENNTITAANNSFKKG